jgi:hypothetical protein
VERALDTLEKKKDELAREVTEQMATGERLIYRLNPFSSSPGTIPSSPSTEVLMRVK